MESQTKEKERKNEHGNIKPLQGENKKYIKPLQREQQHKRYREIKTN